MTVFVCVSVCLSVCEHISGTVRLAFNLCACYCPWPWLGPLWRRYDMQCTSGFMDDVMFEHNCHK